jgi:cell division septation protein DedD
MTIEFECDCGEILQVSNEYAGKKGKCPACQKIITVPHLSTKSGEDEGHVQEEPKEEPPDLKAEDAADFYTDSENDLGGAFRKSSPYLQGKDLWARIPKWTIPIALVALIAVILLLRTGDRETTQTDLAMDKEEPALLAEEPSEQEPTRDSAVEAPRPEVQPTDASVEKVPEERTPEPREDRVSTLPPAVTQPEEKPAETTEKKPVSPKKEVASVTKPLATGGGFTVNLATFKEKARADQYVGDLKKQGIRAFTWMIEIPEKGLMHRVSTGIFQTREEAERFAADLQEEKGVKTFVVLIPSSQQ